MLRPALDSVYNRSTSVDRLVLELLLQLQLVDDLPDEPRAAEVAKHLKKTRRGKEPGESGLAVKCFQALADDAETLDAVPACILDVWRSDTSRTASGGSSFCRRRATSPTRPTGATSCCSTRWPN
jgi:hypothetical protein